MISMKGIAQIYLILGILLILGIAAYQGWLPLGEVYQGCQVKEELAVVPQLSYYKCEAQAETFLDYVIPKKAGWLTVDKYQITCNIFTPYCDYYVKECNSLLPMRYKYQGKEYQFTCEPYGGKVHIRKIPHSESIYVYKELSEYTVRNEFIPYTLWNYPSAERVYKTKWSCLLPMKDYCISGEDCQFPYKQTQLDFGQATSYVENWVLAPVEYNFDSNKGWYCSGDGNIYNTKTIQLKSGCYLYPADYSHKEECCPGAQLADATCGSDYKWHKKPTQQCFSDFQCPGLGKWSPDYSDLDRKTAIKYSCINNQCKKQSKQTECTTDEACPTGFLCMLNPDTGEGNCVESEVPITKPREPGVITPEVNWLNLIFLGLVVALAIVAGLAGLGFFAPQLRILWNIRNFLIAMVILTILLITVFTVPTLTMGQMIIGVIS